MTQRIFFVKMAHYQSKRIDHLGLVAGFCHDLGLIEIVDNTLNH